MDEILLVESESLRERLCTKENVNVLDRVGKLNVLPGTTWTTTEGLASFYDVENESIQKLVQRHRNEFINDGYQVLPKRELKKYALGFKIPNRGLAVFPKKAALRCGMLLKDNDTAQRVRQYILESQQSSSPKVAATKNTKQNISNIPNVSVGNVADLNPIDLSQESIVEKMATRMTMNALQLSEHANHLTEHAKILSENAGELVEHSRLIYAMLQQVTQNRTELQDLDKRVSALENEKGKTTLIMPQTEEYITPHQIDVLKTKVKAKGNPTTIWKKFNRFFNITRYKHLPKRQYEEAVDWIDCFEDNSLDVDSLF